jgi:hypothetical protein
MEKMSIKNWELGRFGTKEGCSYRAGSRRRKQSAEKKSHAGEYRAEDELQQAVALAVDGSQLYGRARLQVAPCRSKAL